LSQVAALAKDYYGLDVKVKSLTGEYDFNYLLKDVEGRKYILKISDTRNSHDFLDAQLKIIKHLSNSSMGDKFSRHILNKEGKELALFESNNEQFHLRLLSYLEGEFWMSLKEKPDPLHIDLGRFLGNMDNELANFSHPAMHRPYVWDISNAADAGIFATPTASLASIRILAISIAGLVTPPRPPRWISAAWSFGATGARNCRTTPMSVAS
jgi:Ser/Thr protein kinase RdoA (MazF antagonist)